MLLQRYPNPLVHSTDRGVTTTYTHTQTPPSGSADDSRPGGTCDEPNVTDAAPEAGVSLTEGADSSGSGSSNSTSSTSSTSSSSRGVQGHYSSSSAPSSADQPSLDAEMDKDAGVMGREGTLASRLASDGGNTTGGGKDSTGGVFSTSGVPGGEGKGGDGASSAYNSWTESADAVVSKVGGYIGEFALGRRGGHGKGGGKEAGGDPREEEEVREHQMKVMFREQQPMPFELAMLEAMLQEVREETNTRCVCTRCTASVFGFCGGLCSVAKGRLFACMDGQRASWYCATTLVHMEQGHAVCVL